MVAVVATLGSASAAFAGTITTPTGNPFVVPGDSHGNPVAFTVVASGYTPGSLVSVEQCDGVLPSDPRWSPTTDCDLGSSPSPAIVDSTGKATFSAANPNFAFTPFKGESPQSLFNCLSPNGPALQGTNGLPDYRNCQVRVSTNNTAITADQAFFAIQLPEAPTGPTAVGSCQDSVSLFKIKPTLTDQTQVGVKIAGNLAKDQTTKLPVNNGGTCTGVVRPGDTHVPQPTGALNPKSQAVAFLGNTGCANGATAQAVDATAALQYPPTGKITWTFTQTYTDLLTSLVKPYKMQAAVSIVGLSATQPDVANLSGIVLSGVNPGAAVNGGVWEDPVALTHGVTGYNTGYELDLTSAAGCADGTANNATIAQVLSGGGSTATPSLLGTVTGPLVFTVGQ